MAKGKKKTARMSVKKKSWVPIIAPKLFNNAVLGETYVTEPKEALGKSVTVNLGNLMRDPKKQNINVTFRVDGQKEGKVTSEFVAFRIVPSSIKRMVRRDKRKVPDSFFCKTKDGRIVLVKPFMVTKSKANKSALTKIRRRARSVVASFAARNDYLKLVEEVVSRNLQRTLYNQISRGVFPLSTCEIRWFSLVTGEKQIKNAEPKIVKARIPKSAKKEPAREVKKEEKPEEKTTKKEDNHAKTKN